MGTSQTIYQKAIKGGQFIFLGKLIQEALIAAQFIVLAHLLVPRDFGLMGIVLLSISVIKIFTNPGLIEAFIQKKEHQKEDLSVIWTFGLFRGFLLFGIVFLLSPLVAKFFDSSGKLDATHMIKPHVLVSSLKDSDSPAVEAVYAGLSPETQTFIRNSNEDLMVLADHLKLLVSDLNTLIDMPDFYQSTAFTDIVHEKDYQQLMQAFPDHYQKLNRLLLENLFDNQIRKVIFDPQEVCLALRILGTSFILGALGNIGIVFYRRLLDFKQDIGWKLLKTTLSTVITIILAVILRSFWALVYGRLISNVITVGLSYRVHPFRPSLSFNFKILKPYWNFGRHILSSSILRFFILEGDDIFVGKVLGPVTLGFYRYAYKFANMVATQIGDVLSHVTFPTLSRLQDNIPKLRNGYVKSIQLLSLIVFPVSGGLFILAEDFVLVVLGEQWLPIVPTMRILCFLGISRCTQVGNVIRALGRPDIEFKVLQVRLALIVVSIYPLTMKFGLPGTAMSVTFSTLLIIPILFYYIKKLIGYSFFDYLKVASLPAFCTLIMILSIYMVRLLIHTHNIVTLTLLVFSGVITYLLSVLILQMLYKDYDVISLLKELLGKKG